MYATWSKLFSGKDEISAEPCTSCWVRFDMFFNYILWFPQTLFFISKTKPLIIKADDLQAKISPNWRSFIRWADSHSYTLSLGLICNSLASAPATDLKYLRNLNRWKNELWLHGWDHEVGNNIAEFSGHSLEYQTTHLKESIKWAKKKLGLELRTFGPPGNRFDSFTSAAFLANPQLKVWFHTDDSLNLPYVIKIRSVSYTHLTLPTKA